MARHLAISLFHPHRRSCSLVGQASLLRRSQHPVFRICLTQQGALLEIFFGKVPRCGLPERFVHRLNGDILGDDDDPVGVAEDNVARLDQYPATFDGAAIGEHTQTTLRWL